MFAGLGCGGSTAGVDIDVGDPIANSLMLDSASSQYLSRTFGTPTSGGDKKWSIRIPFKRGKLGVEQMFVGCGAGATECRIAINTDDTLTVFLNNATYRKTTAVFRDPAAHIDLLITLDTDNATAQDRLRIYSNGVELTAFTTNATVSSGATFTINTAVSHYFGRYSGGSYFDGYIDGALIFVDGQALTPSSFGRTSADTGQWVNKTYAGTYGNNGFKLDFANSADLGNDVSGNNNDWTTNGGISSASQYSDTPTNSFLVMNPLDTNTSLTETVGNLKVTNGGAAYRSVRGTMALPSTGKYYFEAKNGTLTSGSVGVALGLETQSMSLSLNTTDNASTTEFWGMTGINAIWLLDKTSTMGGSIAGTIAANSILQMAVDCTNNKVWFGINNTWYDSSRGTTGNPSAGTNATMTDIVSGLFPVIMAYSNNATANFGNRGDSNFAYTPPTGFSALCTANLPTPNIIKPALHFNAKTRTGTGATYSVTGELFQPDLVWTKGRSGATDHALYDSVRGVQKQLESNTTTAESTEATGLTAFNSDGYTAGSLAQMNTNAATYIDWLFKGGGAAVSNTSGSITSSVSANTTAGISIVTYTGTGANATVGHGLGVAPKLIIVKNRTTVRHRPVYHANLTSAAYFLYLSLTNAQASDATQFQGVAPTSTVFSLGTAVESNQNTNSMLALCFAEVEGFSKAFAYSGNASTDGVFVYCGFKPRWVILKQSSSTTNWFIVDTARDTYNVIGLGLNPNVASAETTGDTFMDATSNGFKIRQSSSAMNASGGAYIGFAIAEAPLKYATAR